MLVSLNISTIENVTLYNVLIIKYNVVVPKLKILLEFFLMPCKCVI
jgi:hypothetical protein